MGGIVRHRAGLHIAGQIGLDADAALEQQVHHGGILGGAHGMPDTRRAQLIDRGDNALCSGRFPGMHGDLPTGVAALLKVPDKKFARPVAFVPGQIERDDFLPVVEEGPEFTPGAGRTVGAGEDADKVGLHPGGGFALAHALDHRSGDFGRIEIIGVGHEERTEPQLEVTDPLALRILHIFAGHPPAGVIIGQHRGHPPELGQELDQTGLRRADHDMRLEFLEGVPGQRDAVLPAEVEDGGEADTAIEMAVEIDEGRAGRHEQGHGLFSAAGRQGELFSARLRRGLAPRRRTRRGNRVVPPRSDARANCRGGERTWRRRPCGGRKPARAGWPGGELRGPAGG